LGRRFFWRRFFSLSSPGSSPRRGSGYN
jgi:hypothetical protein